MLEFLTMVYHGFSYGAGGVLAYYLISGAVSLMAGRARPVP